jgi:hypothetical protein
MDIGELTALTRNSMACSLALTMLAMKALASGAAVVPL